MIGNLLAKFIKMFGLQLLISLARFESVNLVYRLALP